MSEKFEIRRKSDHYPIKSPFISENIKLLPATSHENRILNSRIQIKKLMQIFQESKEVIEQHLKGFKELQKKDKLPLYMKATYDKSIKGLEHYLTMMATIQS